jgi:hypothetical protein
VILTPLPSGATVGRLPRLAPDFLENTHALATNVNTPSAFVETAQDFVDGAAAFPLDAGGVESGKDGRKLILEFCPQDG